MPRLRRPVAAGEALNLEILAVWRRATGLEIADGLRQTVTGQLTAVPVGEGDSLGNFFGLAASCASPVSGWSTIATSAANADRRRLKRALPLQR